MNQLLKRIEKLEIAATPLILKRWVGVIKHEHDNESDRDCIVRHGHDPDEQGVRFTIRTIVSPKSW